MQRKFLAYACMGVAAVLYLPGVLMADITLNTPDYLSNCNSGIPSGLCSGDNVTATVTSSTSTTILLDFKPNSNFLLWDSGAFAFNWSASLGGSITGVSFTGTSTSGTAAIDLGTGNSGAEDGFGMFTNKYNIPESGGVSVVGLTDLMVTITGTSLSLAGFTANGDGHIFAAHVAPKTDTSSTGFVTDGPAGSGGGGQTPEPVTLLLTGSALAAVGLMKKRGMIRGQ